jgi:hypothetical protein
MDYSDHTKQQHLDSGAVAAKEIDLVSTSLLVSIVPSFSHASTQM